MRDERLELRKDVLEAWQSERKIRDTKAGERQKQKWEAEKG